MMMKHNFGSRKLSPSGYHRGEKGKRRKKMDAFSKMLKIGKKSERLTCYQLPSQLPKVCRPPSLRPLVSPETPTGDCSVPTVSHRESSYFEI